MVYFGIRHSKVSRCRAKPSQDSNNVPGEDSETYYRGSIAIQVMNDLITNFQDRMSDRNHTEIFTLLPSLFSKH